jgi:hypothetical protein
MRVRGITATRSFEVRILFLMNRDTIPRLEAPKQETLCDTRDYVRTMTKALLLQQIGR